MGIHYDDKIANEKGFFFRINGQNCKIMTYKGSDKDIIIPDTINGKPVIGIGKRVFAGKEIESVSFTGSLRKIGEEAFLGCKLKEVILPEGIRKIGKNAFGECKELNNVRLNGGDIDVDVDWHAFENTPFVNTPDFVILGNMILRLNPAKKFYKRIVRIPDGIKAIKREATYNGANKINWDFEGAIKQIEIPVSVKRIEDRAFAGFPYLEEVLIECSERFHYIDMGKEVFGKVLESNPFKRTLLKEELGCGYIYYAKGLQKFKQLEVRDSGTLFIPLGIYIPPSKFKEFWECVQIKYRQGYPFHFSINLEDYYELMLTVPSLKEQIQMVKCMKYSFGGGRREKFVLFLQRHINKAVDYAVRENDLEQLQFYKHMGLLQEEKGFRMRHGKYLIENYQNETAKKLQEYLSGQIA